MNRFLYKQIVKCKRTKNLFQKKMKKKFYLCRGRFDVLCIYMVIECFF